MVVFYQLLVNTIIASVTTYTVWFAITFYAYLQTQSVVTTSIISGIFLITTALSSFWFGSLVDKYRKKTVMLASSVVSAVMFAVGFVIYILAGDQAFTQITNPILWIFIIVLLIGVLVSGIRNIALPTIVTFLIPEERRDKANGLVGTASGVAFLVVSVISGFLVAHSGMYLVLIFGVLLTFGTLVHLWLIQIPEKKIVHQDGKPPGLDIKGTLKILTDIPGLLALILFTMFNNFLGGVFMSLMDAYGLSLVEVQVWGLIWGFLSSAFIIGGLIIAKVGLGKNPLRALFLANIIIWAISCVFTLQPSIPLLIVGCFIYLTVVPFIEAAEHTIIQKVVPAERQGRVFGFAQSVEQAASPLTAFAIGPITQYLFIPFMTTGAGVELIGGWYGVGPARGIALVFTITGILGLIITILAMNTKYYKLLSQQYLKQK